MVKYGQKVSQKPEEEEAEGEDDDDSRQDTRFIDDNGKQSLHLAVR